MILYVQMFCVCVCLVCVCVCMCEEAMGQGWILSIAVISRAFLGPMRVANHNLGSALRSTISHCHSNVEADQICPQTRYHKA